jgi:hypothetical protein
VNVDVHWAGIVIHNERSDPVPRMAVLAAVRSGRDAPLCSRSSQYSSALRITCHLSASVELRAAR